jgi:hypothetical protein
MRPRTLFLTGLVLGAFLGLAFLLAPVTLLPALFVWTWVIARRPRFVPASGALIGFGALWVLLIGQAAWRCAEDPSCTQPDVGPWLALGAGLVGVGIALGLYSARRLRADSLSHRS